MSVRTRRNTYRPGRLMRILDAAFDWLPWVLSTIVAVGGYMLVKGNLRLG